MKRRYTIAKEIFKEYKVPLSHVIMLFAELFPESFIRNLIATFDVKVKEIPYHELLLLDKARVPGDHMAISLKYQRKHFD